MTTELTPVTEEVTNEAPPALFLHVCTVFKYMQRDSSFVEGTGQVYEGHFTKLVQVELGFAVPYYTAISQALKGMDCAEQIRRGGGTSKSQWLLKKEPALADFRVYEQKAGKKSQSNSKTAILEGKVNDLAVRVETLEETVQALLEALRDKA
jgi:hypothetical protein